MTRLAYVCADDGVPVFGAKGCSVHVQEFIRACLQQDVDVHLFAARLGGTAPPDLAHVPVTVLIGDELGPTSTDEVLARERRAMARDLRVGEWLSPAGPFDLVYERHALWSGGAMQWARDRQVPAVLEVNAPLVEEQQRHRVLRQPELAEAGRRRAFEAADLLLPVSQPLAAWLGTQGVPVERVHVVPNAVAPARFAATPVPALAPERDVVTIGFVGTLKPWHGLHVLVDALGELRGRGAPCRLLVVGDGPERQRLAGQVAARGLTDAVVWSGAVPPHEVPAWLASMDIGVAPYADGDDAYFSPLKVFEYMAAGLPVVASDVGQLPAIVTPATGVLCPPGDGRALADALAEVCASPLVREYMGRRGRATVMAHHTWRGTVRRVLTLARSVARPGERPADRCTEGRDASAPAR